MAVTNPAGDPTLVLRYADVGVAVYASLRVIGDPETTVTWVLEEADLAAVSDLMAGALPDPAAAESPRDGVQRALTTGSFATAGAEQDLSGQLGEQLISAAGWQLITASASAGPPVLFVAPAARLARVPWSLLAVPGGGGQRLIELADILMAVPPNIVNSPRRPGVWNDGAPLLILDPRVPGQRPDSALGSVLGRPDPDGVLTRHFGALMAQQSVLPEVGSAVDLFRNAAADRVWLATQLDRRPARLLFVGHATAADGAAGHADRAALHLADAVPLSAADLMSARLPIPPRAALLACSSGGDYRFDEATGLVAALILGGAVLVTATLWSLPTTAGYRQFCSAADEVDDPMAETVIGVDIAHRTPDAGRAVNDWQRTQLRRWRSGEVAASPLWWAALATFAVDGAR